MKKLLLTCFSIAVIFSMCKKEEEENLLPTVPTNFSCKIEGDNFTDNTPIANLDHSSGVFTIDAGNGTNSIRLIIYNFLDRTVGEEIILNNIAHKAYVTFGTTSYTNTISGKLIFSEIGNSISGIFNVQCNNSVSFETVTVNEGEFTNISY